MLTSLQRASGRSEKAAAGSAVERVAPLRTWDSDESSVRCPLSDKAIVSPIRAGLLLLRCEALIRLCPEDPLSTSHVTR